MLNWENRPVEIANLINPAFCSLLLHSSVGDFSREKKNGMPYALLFLVLPLALHEPTRTSLPNDTRISLTEWVKEQPEEFGHIFVCQTQQLVPYTREAFMFGMQRGLFDTDENGNVIAKAGKLNHTGEIHSSIVSMIKISKFIGRWFGKMEHESLIFKTFGIRL